MSKDNFETFLVKMIYFNPKIFAVTEGSNEKCPPSQLKIKATHIKYRDLYVVIELIEADKPI